MRTMALDYGERRIGVALTDPTGMIAQPLEVVAAVGALERIAALVEEYGVDQIVLGLPLHMDGRRGTQVQATERFGERVAARTGVPVAYLDERWTSREAERTLAEGGVSARKRRGKLDAVAAAILLRTWLAQQAP